MKISEIMSSRVACCRPDTPIREVAKLMAEHHVGEIPVCDEARKPVGVVTDRDIVCRLVAQDRNPLDCAARDCMSAPVVVAPPGMTIEECATLMQENQIRRIPVVDVHGAICGIVSQADLATKAPRRVTADVVHDVSERTDSPSAVATH